MASALGLKVVGYNLSGEPAELQMQYEVFVRDSGLNVSESISVFFTIAPDVTAQQFRSAFTSAIIAEVARLWPTMSLSASDCLIDVVQRGN